jgi:RsiW-degrading membrane proteinase PrsW (M82 family)
MNHLLFISLAPVLIIAFYIYRRDKYEKEPFPELIKALFAGVIIVLPAVIIEKILISFSGDIPGLKNAAYNAFLVAGLTEEALKYLVLCILFWNSSNFNEKFDGIIYAVYIALGFAGIENIFYVFTGGYEVGIVRAITAVPAHSLFGIMMGYYFGLARFNASHRTLYLCLAFLLPFALHGLYDFLAMGNTPVLLKAFVPVFIIYWISGFRKMAKLSDASFFKDTIIEEDDSDRNIL